MNKIVKRLIYASFLQLSNKNFVKPKATVSLSNRYTLFENYRQRK